MIERKEQSRTERERERKKHAIKEREKGFLERYRRTYILNKFI